MSEKNDRGSGQVENIVIQPNILWDIAKEIVECQKKASKTKWENVDEKMLIEDWFDYLDGKLNKAV